MKVKFSFDKAAVERRGHTLEDVHRTVKSLFAAHNLPCVFEGDPLSFQDKGHGDDFACMWDIILSLLRSDWFMDCAAACVWLDEDSEEDMEGKLYAHLLETEDAANDLLERMMPGMAKEAGATEDLKARDPMRWVGLMNCCKAQVEEIIFAELIMV